MTTDEQSPVEDDEPDVPVVISEPEAVTDLSPVQAKTVEATLSEELAAKAVFALNLRTEVLSVSTDKLRLHLRDFRDRLHAKEAWQVPAGVLITLVAALVASDFKDKWIPAATWEAMFVLVAAVSAIFLARALIRRFQARNRKDEIEGLIDQLRKPK